MPPQSDFAQPSQAFQSNANSYGNTFKSTHSTSARAPSTTNSRRNNRPRAPNVPTTTQSSGTWPVPRTASAPKSDLLDAAMALEEEARTLRHLAMQEMNHLSEHAQNSQHDNFTDSQLNDYSQHIQNLEPAALFNADGTMRDDFTPVVGGEVANWWNVSQNQRPASLSINTSHLPADIPDGVDEKDSLSASEKVPGRMQRAFLGQLAPGDWEQRRR